MGGRTVRFINQAERPYYLVPRQSKTFIPYTIPQAFQQCTTIFSQTIPEMDARDASPSPKISTHARHQPFACIP